MSSLTDFAVQDGLAIITLDRPQALNALSHEMIVAIAQQLAAWERDPAVHAIVLRGAGEKAFCAGGDIRAMYDSHHDGSRGYRQFFIDEYRLDYALWRSAKPVIALMDGITMGGGMGLAQAATLRVATTRTRMAMPETGIGLIPDVGGTYFLSRMAEPLSLYLGLTGQIIHAADALYCGLADVVISEDEAQAALLSALKGIDWQDPDTTSRARLRAAVAPLAVDAGAAPLAALAEPLQHHFGQPDVTRILRSLGEASGAHAEWAAKTQAVLAHRSPLSLHVVHRQLTEARGLDLADCFRLEYDLVVRAIEEGDLIEGVRALIVDKDKSPRWQHADVTAVPPARVASFFAGSPGAAHPLADLGRTPC